MSSVRPTKRSLDDLGLGFPPLDTPLHEIKHELIAKAQRLPDEHASGGAERILAISDRLWFKVKVGESRGAGGQIEAGDCDVPQRWWLVAGGLRRADSKEQDFYARLEVECRRAGAGTSASVNSDHLLPQDIDKRRFEAEQAALGVIALQRAVREGISRSANSGHPVEGVAGRQRLIIWVKSGDADTYLAISAEGFFDPKELAIILDAVPGMTADDWAIEPSEVLGIKPDVGQLVYSAMIPPESLAEVLAADDGDVL
ncbi:hypothetical protein DY023_11125 [Microbacterium bovistercoris]|uniref:Uncharacterized protein n=1 Tax=Microbacterium bovistercoris TaxID=2293570 RepID=A0A371NTZ2_9MICO|nr:hypothetical protein [Microbacterium bovistercoris]REJ05123.1 hypothetical protein DY023_11125 [Microbacterium bovistercoris]